MIAGMTTGQAADKISYQDIARRLPGPEQGFRSRTFVVTTLDGKKHKGKELKVESDSLRVIHQNNSRDDLPKDQVTKVEVSTKSKFYRIVGYSAVAPFALAWPLCSSGDKRIGRRVPCLVVHTVLFSPVLAFTVASTPFCLYADAITLFTPPKSYEIVQQATP